MLTAEQFAPQPADRVREALRAVIEGEGVSKGLFEDERPPTDEAKRECVRQLVEAADRFPIEERFPFPHMEAGGDGELRCEWNRGVRGVSAVFSPEGNGCLYVFNNSGDGHASYSQHRLPDPERLVESLRWLVPGDLT
jgi:hypothetical protein